MTELLTLILICAPGDLVPETSQWSLIQICQGQYAIADCQGEPGGLARLLSQGSISARLMAAAIGNQHAGCPPLRTVQSCIKGSTVWASLMRVRMSGN